MSPDSAGLTPRRIETVPPVRIICRGKLEASMSAMDRSSAATAEVKNGLHYFLIATFLEIGSHLEG